jgi:hypothetical protein
LTEENADVTIGGPIAALLFSTLVGLGLPWLAGVLHSRFEGASPEWRARVGPELASAYPHGAFAIANSEDVLVMVQVRNGARLRGSRIDGGRDGLVRGTPRRARSRPRSRALRAQALGVGFLASLIIVMSRAGGGKALGGGAGGWWVVLLLGTLFLALLSGFVSIAAMSTSWRHPEKTEG